MAEEERQEEEQEEMELEDGSPSEQPEVIYRPIEVEVNLLRRKLNGLVFLVLILVVIVLGVVALMYRSERKNAIAYQVQWAETRNERDTILQQAQALNRNINILVSRLAELRKTNVDVANLWKELNMGPVPGKAAAPASDTSSDTGP